MGNNVSNTDLKERIDLIATNYIQSNKNFENLIDENICNNLVILTSKIINNNLDHKQIEFLYENKISKDKVIYFNKDDLDNINLPNNMKKKRYCLGISKFYIKLAHIYASIKKTIEPSNSNLCSKNKQLDQLIGYNLFLSELETKQLISNKTDTSIKLLLDTKFEVCFRYKSRF